MSIILCWSDSEVVPLFKWGVGDSDILHFDSREPRPRLADWHRGTKKGLRRNRERIHNCSICQPVFLDRYPLFLRSPGLTGGWESRVVSRQSYPSLLQNNVFHNNCFHLDRNKIKGTNTGVGTYDAHER